MKKELLLSVATGVLAIVPAAGVWAACTSSPDCFSLGYKYSASDCPNGGVKCPFDTSMYFCFSPESECTYSYTADYCSSQCKYTGTTSCQKNGKTYYASCGSSKCSYGQNCSNGTCVTPAPSCTYQYTEQDCSRQCKYIGSVSCNRNGTTYYQSCGSSKCASGQTCENGTCNFQCIYQYTASDCTNLCKNIGSKSCVRNGTTYYESCGASKCSSGQTCNGGKCESGGSSSGGGGSLSGTYFYCCDDTGYGCEDYYALCKKYTYNLDCSEAVPMHESIGCSPDFQICVQEGPGLSARFHCP